MWKTVCEYVHVCVLLWWWSNSTLCVVSDNLTERYFIDIVHHLTEDLQASAVLVVTIPVCSIDPQWHTHITMLLNWHILHRFPRVTTHTHIHAHTATHTQPHTLSHTASGDTSHWCHFVLVIQRRHSCTSLLPGRQLGCINMVTIVSLLDICHC